MIETIIYLILIVSPFLCVFTTVLLFLKTNEVSKLKEDIRRKDEDSMDLLWLKIYYREELTKMQKREEERLAKTLGKL